MKNCRSCSAPLGAPFLSLGASPLSNSYLTLEQLRGIEPTYPLDLYRCDQCFLVQLDEFERAEKIFSHEYAYFSSFSDTWLSHCRDYVAMMMGRFSIDASWFVVEIASNDGYLLQYFKERGIPLLGIEPAFGTAFAALRKGIPTEPEYFTAAFARKLVESGRSANLIIVNNVLAHNPDLNDFIKGVKTLLAPTGIVTMEFPHLLTMIEQVEFDTIYHEHFSYFSMFSAIRAFENHQMAVFDVEELPTHGGSLRIFAQHASTGVQPISGRVAELLSKERDHGLFTDGKYKAFVGEIQRVKRDLLLFLIEQKQAGRKIVGYGAPAKGNTLLNYCGIRTDFIDFTVDRSPVKQGTFLPGSRIPVLSPDAIRDARPDFLLILPWNIKDEIREQMAFVREWGCRFVTAIPALSVLE